MHIADILTEKQRIIFAFMIKYFQDNHYSPSTREIGKHFGITVKGAYDHIKAIEKKGYIKISSRLSRGIKYLHFDVKMVNICKKKS